MVGKGYVLLIGFFILFTQYYQFITTAEYSIADYLTIGQLAILLLAGYAYFFKKQLFQARFWRYGYWLLLVHLLVSAILQIVPSSYYGNFSDGGIVVNIFTFCLMLVFYIPLYVAVYRLQVSNHPKKKK